MARFTWVPDYTSSIDEEPKVLEAGYGDGYSQRVNDGVNSLMKKWSVKFFRRSAEISDIRTFLKAANGVTYFDWLDPDGEDLRYVCKKWSRSFDGGDGQTLTADFQQVPA